MKARGQPQAQLDPGAEATSTEVYLFQRQLGFLWGPSSTVRPARSGRQEGPKLQAHHSLPSRRPEQK